MNISSSISEISYQSGQAGRISQNKIYLWPEYNAGKVYKIPAIHERSEQNYNYIKRSNDIPTKESFESKIEINLSYTSKGNLINSLPNYTPGSIFEALA